jgi:hypothetical protein
MRIVVFSVITIITVAAHFHLARTPSWGDSYSFDGGSLYSAEADANH